MKVAYEIVQARRQELAELLNKEGFANIRTVCRRFGISEATARRDLAVLADAQKITRTYGGALGDYEHRFTSFQERSSKAWEAKTAIANRAVNFLRPRGTYFFDAGSTSYALAERLTKADFGPLTIVTNNLRVADILSRIPEIELYMTGGRFLLRQASFFGKQALVSLKQWKFDAVFMGAEGLDGVGLWNTQPEIVQFQRAVLDRSAHSYFLMDSTKWGQKTDYPICGWNKVDSVISDLPYKQFVQARIPLKAHKFISAIETTKSS